MPSRTALLAFITGFRQSLHVTAMSRYVGTLPIGAGTGIANPVPDDTKVKIAILLIDLQQTQPVPCQRNQLIQQQGLDW